MDKRIVYGTCESEALLKDLEELRIKRDVDGMIERALRPDSNILILNEVLTSIHEGPITPVQHKNLLQAAAPTLTRKAVISTKDRMALQARALTAVFAPTTGEGNPEHKDLDEDAGIDPVLDASRALKPFLFVADALPGSCLAESICSSTDGTLVAYITGAAVKLQADRSERVRKKINMSTRDRQESRRTSRIPRLVNVICLDPHEAWSLDIEGAIPSHTEGSLELLGIDHDRVFLLHERGKSKAVHALGLRNNRLETSFNLGDAAGALELSLDGQVLSWIDTSTASLVAIGLQNAEQASIPLQLPTALEAKDLHRLVLSPGGEIGLMLVSPRAEVSGIAFGTIRLRDTGDQAPAGEVRWWRRRDLFFNTGFENAVVTRSRSSTIENAGDVAYYLFGTDSTLRRLSLQRLRDTSFNAIKPMELLSLVLVGEGAKKVLFPKMAVASERPLMATYQQVDGAIKLWDITDDTLLLSVPCPFHIESLHFAAHDRLLVIRTRTMKQTSSSITITFLDFLLCAGVQPSTLTEDFLPLVKPLQAWAPESVILSFMERLALFNGKAAKEMVA